MNDPVKKQQNYASLPHILVVDDDARICDLVARYLIDAGFVVLTAADPAEARAVLARFEFDALVVDVMMPGESGLAFTADLRAQNVDLPVLLLTALGEVDDRISGLESGADDYLAKPFEPRELVLRLQAILRRRAKPGLKDLKIGDWVFDPVQNALGRDGAQVKLTDMEANLLKALAQHAGDVVSREALADLCGIDAGERTIDVQVTRLRKKIEADSKAPRYLQTVRGKGYLLRV